MKSIRLFFCLLLSGSLVSLYAQEELGNGLLLPQFEQGIVVFKDGTRYAASLNYSTIQEKMLFLEADSTVFEIAKPIDVSVVIIGERRFVPFSQTHSSTSYGSWQSDMGGTVKLNPDEKFRMRTDKFYYLKPGKSYKRFHSAKTLGKLFKGFESEIARFANEQSIDFTKTDDVARIVEYGFSLTSKPK